MLPLHLAFRHKLDEDLLQQLLEAYPNGLNQKDNRGRTPIDHSNDVSFSGRFVQVYARVASSEHGKVNIADERDEVNGVEVASIGRVKDMESHYKAKTRQFQMRAIDNNSGSRNSIPKEMRSTDLEDQVQLLQASLERENADSRDMVQALKHSRANEKHFEDKFQIVLNNQRSLHALCLKQHQQLEKAQNIRMQMLRSTLNNLEDRRTLSVASEILQMSSNLVVSTDDILSHIASKLKKEGQKENPITLFEPEENTLPHNNNYWMRSITEHGDEVSAITEVSQL